MWETCAAKVREMGGHIHMGQRVIGCSYDDSAATWTVTSQDLAGGRHRTLAQHVISSAPIRELAAALSPRLPEEALGAANALRYRDFATVMLILKDRHLFDDNWIYIHDPQVKVGRVQNFKSWSPEMVPDPSLCCYGLEYFCFEGDGLWCASDPALIDQAKRELEQIGLARADEVTDGCVVRQAKAYPVYDEKYAENVATIRTAIGVQFPSLHLVGRNGMHKYNNQDHAMMTAMLCVQNILQGHQVYDLWRVNQDAEYHEAGSAGDQSTGLRRVPQAVKVKVGPHADAAISSGQD